ncbi:HPP family protein [Phaeovulum vinaykumarii]|uniref:Tryptophan synthase, alpha chain n=1 Tax=Phaeovulum vinaykumarii TaxID=407234 RepID=A0A1N7LUZ9_9RHOB|nr:HPP family protein [Phaeovulum vinaykumarii]SIS77660.1 tryptophan synthase, alpha chain [Phaeovulum vinaykumarii]SOC07348.1 tryptophan synthase alpha chain [Phaeovulum vinaykumarii]
MTPPPAPARPLLRRLTALGPAMGRIAQTEALRAGLGAGIGIAIAALLVTLLPDPRGTGIYLIAPLGATAVLAFGLPNSPMAQPWSAVAGNTIAATAALIVAHLTDPPLTQGMAVGAAVIAMSSLRALHPPGAAIALFVSLEAEAGHPPDLWFPLMPVAVMTGALVALAVLYNRLTGRVYPLRRLAPPAAPAPGSDRPSNLDTAALEGLLDRFNQSSNLGAADLGRMLAEAEELVAETRFGATRCDEVMTRVLLTVTPMTRLVQIAQLMGFHDLKSLPVVERGKLRGMIFQGPVLRALSEGRPGLRARDLARPVVPVAPDLPVGVLLARLSSSHEQAVPVTEAGAPEGRLLGLITRTDVLMLMFHRVRLPNAPQPPEVTSPETTSPEAPAGPPPTQPGAKDAPAPDTASAR